MESLFNYVFWLTIISAASAGKVTPFNNCPGQPPVVSLNMNGCTSQPCKFVRGSELDIAIEIVANKGVSSLTTNVVAFAMGTTTTYPLPPEVANVCNHLVDGECPLDQGEDVTYKFKFPVLKSYPLISLVIEFSIVSESGTVGCLRLPAEVVDP